MLPEGFLWSVLTWTAFEVVNHDEASYRWTLGGRARRLWFGFLGGGAWRAAAGAWLLTALAGWLDEGIQGLLPNRVYDLRDVGFNALAGALALASAAALEAARQRARRGEWIPAKP